MLKCFDSSWVKKERFLPKLLIKLTGLGRKKYRLQGFIILKVSMCRGEKATPEFFCHFQGMGGVSPPDAAWGHCCSVWPLLINWGVSMVWIFCTHLYLDHLGFTLVWLLLPCPFLQDFPMEIAFFSAFLPGAGWCSEPMGNMCTLKAREILAVAFYWGVLGQDLMFVMVRAGGGKPHSLSYWLVCREVAGMVLFGEDSLVTEGCSSKSGQHRKTQECVKNMGKRSVSQWECDTEQCGCAGVSLVMSHLHQIP